MPSRRQQKPDHDPHKDKRNKQHRFQLPLLFGLDRTKLNMDDLRRLRSRR